MHTIIHRHHQGRFPSPESKQELRSPHYDCMDLPGALRLTVYIPGVDASGVDITTHHIRANWQALHLENVQRDYQLKLRLGLGFDFEALQASVARGVLTIVLPKVKPAVARLPLHQRQVA